MPGRAGLGKGKVMWKFFASVLLLAICSVQAHAGWMTGKIHRIQIDNTTGVYQVYLVGDPVNECGTHSLRIDNPSGVGAERILSALLTHQAMDRKVQFYIAQCVNQVGHFSKIEDYPN